MARGRCQTHGRGSCPGLPGHRRKKQGPGKSGQSGDGAVSSSGPMCCCVRMAGQCNDRVAGDRRPARQLAACALCASGRDAPPDSKWAIRATGATAGSPASLKMRGESGKYGLCSTVGGTTHSAHGGPKRAIFGGRSLAAARHRQGAVRGPAAAYKRTSCPPGAVWPSETGPRSPSRGRGGVGIGFHPSARPGPCPLPASLQITTTFPDRCSCQRPGRGSGQQRQEVGLGAQGGKHGGCCGSGSALTRS